MSKAEEMMDIARLRLDTTGDRKTYCASISDLVLMIEHRGATIIKNGSPDYGGGFVYEVGVGQYVFLTKTSQPGELSHYQKYAF